MYLFLLGWHLTTHSQNNSLRVLLYSFDWRAFVCPEYGNPQTGLLNTLWKPDRVLRSPLRALCA